MKKPRDYRKEYLRDQASPRDIRNRAARNKARAESSLKVGDPREIDHKKPLSKGGSNNRSNRRIVSRATNRQKSKN